MEDKQTETQKLAHSDVAIEIMAAMRASRISRIAAEKEKTESERDNKLIERLNKELELLREERHLMYSGDSKIQNKILNEYSKKVTEFFLGQKNER